MSAPVSQGEISNPTTDTRPDPRGGRILAPTHAFGLQSGVQSNVLAIDDTSVVYPVGRAIVVYNTDSRKIAFVREGTQERGEITSLAISQSKKYLAVGERGDSATISIYHISSQKRVKLLPASPLDMSSNEFVTVAFSADSKMVAAVAGDFTIALWLWDRQGRLVALHRNPLGNTMGIDRITFNPSDCNCMATTGPRFFKMWRFADGGLKVWNVNLHKGKDHPVYTDHTWLSGE